MEFPGGDKLLHFSAYATLMLWFGFIYLPGKAYLTDWGRIDPHGNHHGDSPGNNRL